MCMPRGRGRLSKTMAMSLAREDHSTTPRWRARAKNCVLRRGRPVSRILVKRTKNRRRASRARGWPRSGGAPVVAPNRVAFGPSLGVHVVASPGSHAALEKWAR